MTSRELLDVMTSRCFWMLWLSIAGYDDIILLDVCHDEVLLDVMTSRVLLDVMTSRVFLGSHDK